VDGLLDEETWVQALRIPLPYEVMPGDNTPAPVETECLVSYDTKYLYVAFRASDPDPSQIRARIADRDTPWQDDFVGVMVDPFNDERRGFELFVNPLGVQMDLSRNDVGSEEPEDETWDTIWSSAGRITHDGYSVEMAVPFTSLRFPRTEEEQTWGFIAFRAYPRSVRHQISSVPFDRDRNCFFCQAAKIEGFTGITPGRNLEFDPTLTTIRTDTLASSPGESIVSGNPDMDVGLSLRWGMTPNMSLNAALNPDFSQVEADAAQLDINNRFTLFYPEKRPFFLEGADFFDTPLQAVYTRTVAEPAWGLKMTGKEGGHAMGIYVTRDELANLLFPSNQESDDTSLEREVTSGVFRYRRDVGRGSTIGALLTAREGEGYRNRVLGADGYLRLTPMDEVRFQAIGSNTAYPREIIEVYDQPEGSFDGYGLEAEYIHSSRSLSWWAGYEELDPRLRVDAGFIPRVDTRSVETGVEYTFWGDSSPWFTEWAVGAWGDRTSDHDGTLTDRSVGLFSNYSGPMQSYWEMNLFREKEYFDGLTYGQTIGLTHLNFQPTGKLYVWFTGRFGDAIDYDNSRPARELEAGPGLRYTFGRRFQVEFDDTFEQLTVGGKRLYRASLNQFRIVYQFNARTFMRAIIQYTDISRNTDLYDEEVETDSHDLFTQLLFSYKFNPQTVLFLGYSNAHDDEDRQDLVMKEQTFFFKLGYAWIL